MVSFFLFFVIYLFNNWIRIRPTLTILGSDCTRNKTAFLTLRNSWASLENRDRNKQKQYEVWKAFLTMPLCLMWAGLYVWLHLRLYYGWNHWRNLEKYRNLPSDSSSLDVVQFKNASYWRHWRCHQVVQHWPTMEKFISQHWKKKWNRIKTSELGALPS